jgi:hypothetical protein
LTFAHQKAIPVLRLFICAVLPHRERVFIFLITPISGINVIIKHKNESKMGNPSTQKAENQGQPGCILSCCLKKKKRKRKEKRRKKE